MELLGLPTKVIEGYVLPNLEWNDALCFRRVCKWTKAVTDVYLKAHPELAPEIEINEKDKSVAAFLKMGIPTTKIFLHNRSGYDFYQDNREDLLTFLEVFGPFLKALRVDQITAVPFGMELDFLEGLKNLESLEASRFGGYRREVGPEDMLRVLVMRKSLELEDPRIFQDGKPRFPSDFIHRLKTLRIGNNDDANFLDLFEHVRRYLFSGRALTSVAVPFTPGTTVGTRVGYEYLRDRPMALAFALLVDFVDWRKQNNNDGSYYEIDFQNFHNVGDTSKQFQDGRPESEVAFLTLNTLRNMKLQNVCSSWFMGIEGVLVNRSNPDTEDLGVAVHSMVNIHPSVLPVIMPNLERVEVKSTARSSPGNNWRNQRPDWPSLKSLVINVDSKVGECPDAPTDEAMVIVHRTSTRELFDFFFEDVSRTAMTELQLEFLGGAKTVAIPNTEDIASACPNLKKLTLSRWPGFNRALTKLWSGLPGLEEISLEYCEGLGNVAFVGEGVRTTIFQKLPKLKKLSLKGLDQMPKITDTLFSLVIRYTKLTHLILTSDAPIKQITAAGIRSLSDGRFKETIQKFPFKDWSLSSASEEEFKELKKMFRSSNML